MPYSAVWVRCSVRTKTRPAGRTASPVYWTGSVVAGAALPAWAVAARFPRVRPAMTAAATCAATAALFVVVYRVDFFLLLP